MTDALTAAATVAQVVHCMDEGIGGGERSGTEMCRDTSVSLEFFKKKLAGFYDISKIWEGKNLNKM